MKDIKSRVQTAVVLVVSYLALVILAEYFFFFKIVIPIVSLLVTLGAAMEAYKLYRRCSGTEDLYAKMFHIISHLFPLLAISVISIGTLYTDGYNSWLILALTQAFLSLTGITLLLVYPMLDEELSLVQRGEYLGMNLSGFLLVVAGGGSLIALCTGPNAGIYLGFLLIVVCVSDIAAYFVGNFLGEEKLSPVVSPSKTKAGGYAGVLISGVVGAIVWPLFPLMQVPLAYAFIVSSLLAIVSQIGDLLQSYIKRRAGVKDSGTLLPGHGGVLDRIDGVLFAAPFFLCTLAFFEFYEHLPPHP